MLKKDPNIGPGDNPSYRLSQTEVLDSNLAESFSRGEKIAQIRLVSLEEALDLADDIFEGYRTAILDHVRFFQKKKFEVEIKAIDNGNPDEISFVLTAKNYDRGEHGHYGIPNLNFLYDDIGAMERGEKVDGTPGKKYVMTAADASKDFIFSMSHGQIETFEDPVRIVLSPGEGVKPYKFNVQYTPQAFLEGMQHLSGSLKGSESYCHLFHEVLRNKLKEDIRNSSKDFLGETFVPEIKQNSAAVKVNRLVLNANIGTRFKSFAYEMLPGDFESPFPVVMEFSKISED